MIWDDDACNHCALYTLRCGADIRIFTLGQETLLIHVEKSSVTLENKYIVYIQLFPSQILVQFSINRYNVRLFYKLS